VYLLVHTWPEGLTRACHGAEQGGLQSRDPNEGTRSEVSWAAGPSSHSLRPSRLSRLHTSLLRALQRNAREICN